MPAACRQCCLWPYVCNLLSRPAVVKVVVDLARHQEVVLGVVLAAPGCCYNVVQGELLQLPPNPQVTTEAFLAQTEVQGRVIEMAIQQELQLVKCQLGAQ